MRNLRRVFTFLPVLNLLIVLSLCSRVSLFLKVFYRSDLVQKKRFKEQQDEKSVLFVGLKQMRSS